MKYLVKIDSITVLDDDLKPKYSFRLKPEMRLFTENLGNCFPKNHFLQTYFEYHGFNK